MDYRDTKSTYKPPSGKTMKQRAPAPPPAPEPAPRHIFRNAVPDGAGAKENIMRASVYVHVTYPQGHQTTMTVDGSKALMDLRVELCSRQHLNPSLHALELLSPEGLPLAFKPNALLGSLDLARILIKERDVRREGLRRPAPKIPERARPAKPLRANAKKTVRLVVNYHRTQKAVVRVNPLAPLVDLLPVICDKCDFNPARVLLLRDSLSGHELPLDQCLAQLGIKELYVHDQSLVLQPKMASAPALNYSDSMSSSNLSVGTAEKRGFLGIFRFNSRKSKAEEAMDTDCVDAKSVQSTDAPSNGLSTASVASEARPSTLGQSQSAMNLSRTSPKSDAKKRRAPAPPPTPAVSSLGQRSLDGYQMGLVGTDSMLRKRKAPAAPPTSGSSATTSLDDSSATPTRDSTPAPTPTKVTPPAAPSTAPPPAAPAAAAAAMTRPARTQAATPTPSLTSSCPSSSSAISSPAPSTTTGGSLTAQDSSSSSECGRSLEAESDSEVDASNVSLRSGSLSDASVASYTPGAGLTRVQPAAAAAAAAAVSTTSSSSTTSSAASSRTEESEESADSQVKRLPGSDQAGGGKESLVELRMDATENNRHSAVAWLHSLPGPRLPQGGGAGRSAPEDETLSLGSSSGSSSLPDQGYAASEGMAEAEDCGTAGSPWGTQPASPDKTLHGRGGGGEGRPLGPIKDVSSDSDEGCATWGSRHRPMDISLKDKAGSRMDAYDEDPELTAELNKTLADFDAELNDISRTEAVTPKEYRYALPTDVYGVPVTVVDLVPVTAIDLPEDYGNTVIDGVTKTSPRQPSTVNNGLNAARPSEDKAHNQNNNACRDGGATKRASDVAKRPPPAAAYVASAAGYSRSTASSAVKSENKPTQREANAKTGGIREEEGKPKMRPGENVSTKASPPVGKENDLPPKTWRTPSMNGKEDVGEFPVYRPHLNKDVISAYSASVSQSKITQSSTSRFGLKTFTVVPPKHSPAIATAQAASSGGTAGAIKIDEQGNMVQTGVWQKPGTLRPASGAVSPTSGAGEDTQERSPLLGQAKAFWSSSERQDGGVVASEKQKDSATEQKKTVYPASPETTRHAKKPEDLRNTHPVKREPSLVAKPQEKEAAAAATKEAAEVRKGSEQRVIILEETQTLGSASVPAYSYQPNPQRDLSFLRPSRRTSSQYVASAISKYAKPEGPAHGLEPLQRNAQSGLRRGGRSMQVIPRGSTLPASDGDQRGVPVGSGPPRSPGPTRSMSQPGRVSAGTTGAADEARWDGGGRVVGSSSFSRGRVDAADNKRVSGWPVVSPAPGRGMAGDSRGQGVHSEAPDPGPSHASQNQGRPPKQGMGVNVPAPVVQVNNTPVVTTTTPSTYPVLADRPEPSALPPAGGLFGPVKKFKKVASKPVQQEPCLHNDLMDAIQAGGRDRLKKTPGADPGGLKKRPSQAEDDNERSALLAAIRAKASSGRLKPTKSLAAHELQVIRTSSSSEEHPAVSITRPSRPLSPTPPPHPSSYGLSPPPPHPSSFGLSPPPPPPPPPPPTGPPAPPPQLRRGGAGAGEPRGDPAAAREAMMEAIRSGSAVGNLKKIAAPVKTVQVNGRLGTIQSRSLALSQQ